MNSNSVKTTFATMTVMLAAVCVVQTRSAQSSSATTSQAAPKPLLVLGTEDMVPGDEFPRHRHLGQDEILLIEKGTVHVHLGDQERDLHAGGTVFIPAYTWVSVKNAGNETAGVVFIFSAP